LKQDQNPDLLRSAFCSQGKGKRRRKKSSLGSEKAKSNISANYTESMAD
jgi:hypothetical protein